MSAADGLPDEEGRPAGNRAASEEHAGGAGSSTPSVRPTGDAEHRDAQPDEDAQDGPQAPPAASDEAAAPEGTPTGSPGRPGRARRPQPRHAADADPWWQDGALRALRQLVEAASLEGRPGITVDELRRPPYALPAPHHPNAWGALPSIAHREGWLVHAGFVQSPAASRHASVVRRWRLAPPLARALRAEAAR